MSDDEEQTFWDWKLAQSQHIRFTLRNRRLWRRIPYGQEDLRCTRPLPLHCPRCGAARGQLHLQGCDDVSFPGDP